MKIMLCGKFTSVVLRSAFTCKELGGIQCEIRADNYILKWKIKKKKPTECLRDMPLLPALPVLSLYQTGGSA